MKRNSHLQLMARGLGWFSIGLGATQIIAPRRLSRLIGVSDQDWLMRFLGVREIASGIGILRANNPAPGLWARVAGDTMDLALLGMAFTLCDSDRRRLAGATLAVAGVTAADAWCSARSSDSEALRTVQLISVNCTPQEAYRYWRLPANSARFMKSIRAVRASQIMNQTAGEQITWKFGSVRFPPLRHGRGTEVRLELDGLFSSTGAHQDLRRFKQLVETGEIPTTAGQPFGPSRTAVVGPVVQLLKNEEAA